MLRSFAKAEAYIYVDQAKMNETRDWLKEKQRDNGCFRMVGVLFNNRMKVRQAFKPPGRRRSPEPGG